jgi:hypothetical protein
VIQDQLQLIVSVCEGSMIHKAGAGPEPIPHKQLNVAKLTDAIKFAVSPSAKVAAKAMADQIKSEVRCIVQSHSRLAITVFRTE